VPAIMTGDRTAKSSADARLDGDRVTADPDDGDVGHATRRYMSQTGDPSGVVPDSSRLGGCLEILPRRPDMSEAGSLCDPARGDVVCRSDDEQLLKLRAGCDVVLEQAQRRCAYTSTPVLPSKRPYPINAPPAQSAPMSWRKISPTSCSSSKTEK
jgi:hypothetical protein